MFGISVEARPLRRSSPTGAGHPRRGRPSRKDPYGEPGVEPRLGDLLSDPVTLAIMRCDGVSGDTLDAVIRDAQNSLKTRRRLV